MTLDGLVAASGRSTLRVMRTMLVLAAVAVTLAVAADASSGRKFVSTRYGYSIVLPAAWTSQPASLAWAGGPPYQNRRQVDFHQTSDGRALVVAALRVPRGSTLQEWATRYVGSALPSVCAKSRGYRATTLGGAPALAFTGHCDVHDINIGLTIRRGRGYVFGLSSPSANSASADGAVFEAGRRSFRFIP